MRSYDRRGRGLAFKRPHYAGDFYWMAFGDDGEMFGRVGQGPYVIRYFEPRFIKIAVRYKAIWWDKGRPRRFGQAWQLRALVEAFEALESENPS